MSILFEFFMQASVAPFLSASSFNLLVRTSKQLKHGFEQVLQKFIMKIEGGRLEFLKMMVKFKTLGDAKQNIENSYITLKIKNSEIKQAVVRESWTIAFKVIYHRRDGKSTENGKREIRLTWVSFLNKLKIHIFDDQEDDEFSEGNCSIWFLEPSETDFVFAEDSEEVPYQGREFKKFADLWFLITSGELATLPFDEKLKILRD